MKAMILAAGEGRRMLPLTADKPKPLLEVAGVTLIEHQIRRLLEAGVSEIVVNVAYLKTQIVEHLSKLSLPCKLNFSVEAEPLETGGGVLNALPLLGEEPFILVNGDVWLDYDLRLLLRRGLHERVLAHLLLVANPEHNPEGDFVLLPDGRVAQKPDSMRPSTGEASDEANGGVKIKVLTFSGVSLIHPKLLLDYPQRRECFPLVEALRYAMDGDKVTGEATKRFWLDVGTPERLDYLRRRCTV